jgi:hypothetical protein
MFDAAAGEAGTARSVRKVIFAWKRRNRCGSLTAAREISTRSRSVSERLTATGDEHGRQDQIEAAESHVQDAAEDDIKAGA